MSGVRWRSGKASSPQKHGEQYLELGLKTPIEYPILPFDSTDNISNYPLTPNRANAHFRIAWKQKADGQNILSEVQIPRHCLAAVERLSRIPEIVCSYWGRYEFLEAWWEHTLFGPQFTGTSLRSLQDWVSTLEVVDGPKVNPSKT